MPLQVVIAGAGRMGAAIADIIQQLDAMELVAIWTRDADLDEPVKSADVVIDFSLPGGTMAVLDAVVRHKKPLVCGVSGLDQQQMATLDAASEAIPLVYDRNMSRGIAALNGILGRLTTALGDDFAVSISEVHHQHKKDAPSGTALMLGETLADARGVGPGDIPIASIRRGEVPGEHTVLLATASEELTVTHSVTSRRVFAEGAVQAATWVVSRPAGRYSMHDVLFFDA